MICGLKKSSIPFICGFLKNERWLDWIGFGNNNNSAERSWKKNKNELRLGRLVRREAWMRMLIPVRKMNNKRHRWKPSNKNGIQSKILSSMVVFNPFQIKRKATVLFLLILNHRFKYKQFLLIPLLLLHLLHLPLLFHRSQL